MTVPEYFVHGLQLDIGTKYPLLIYCSILVGVGLLKVFCLFFGYSFRDVKTLIVEMLQAAKSKVD